jgi:hypothetical protein
MSANDIIINKDVENDVLYVMRVGFGNISTRNISANADVTLRLNHVSSKVVGLTIEDFSKVLPRLKDLSDYRLMEEFDNIIEFLNASNLARIA